VRSQISNRKTGVFAALLAVALISVAGCGPKTLSRTEIRAITGEIVSAAERVTAHKSEISIRPEVEASQTGARGRLEADHIYVSLRDPAQASALRQALAGIAQRHVLSLAETSSAGVIRFDLAYDGNRTHSVHVVMPLGARASTRAPHAADNPRLAIILDDLGHDRAPADAVLALPFAVTVSVLPHLPLSAEVAEEAARRGDEVMLHLPMEALPGEGAVEPVELRVGMTPAEVVSAIAGMLETVPRAEGVNNHQGSRATADPALMEAVMTALRARGLFFVDSRTTAATVAYDAAERAGVRAASRKVFLDDTPERDAVLAQLELAARDALRDGSAIAIGHPHPATIAALAEGVPRLEARGIKLVFASNLVY
jgi:uncharacterized protein